MNKREIREFVALVFDFGSEAERKCINNQAFKVYRKLIVDQYAEKLATLALTSNLSPHQRE